LYDREARFNANAEMVTALDASLCHSRIEERAVLNRERTEKYEKNRPPNKGWHELKSTEFQKEMYRNRVAQNSEANALYLEKLKDRNLY
jgi:hypothetical protein